jgi:hypothetical protein
MLCRVALVTTDVSEERIASNIKVTRIGELGTRLTETNNVHRWLVITNVLPSLPIFVNPMLVAIHSSETPVLTTDTAFFIVTAVKTSTPT